ncbi:Synaptic vesicle glycoprotein 2B [Lucilia cuprina]|nr:Synaptic vesicle glycoprotein 2B [Lucilia cuprina]
MNRKHLHYKVRNLHLQTHNHIGGVATSVMSAIVVDIYPTNLRAMAVCISLMLGRIGSVSGTNMVIQSEPITISPIEETMEKKPKEPEPIRIATIDEALEKTRYGKYNIQLIIFSGLVLNNVILESVGISFALPVIACDLDLSYQEQGILGAVCFLGIIVSSHLWGFLADTKGRKETMRPALLLAFLVTLISSISYNFLMMAVLRFINGILISAGSATIFAYLGEFHSQKNRNKAIMCAAFISAFQCKSPKYLMGLNKSDEVLEILKNMHRKNIKGNKNLQDEQYTITTILPDLDTPLRKKTSDDPKSFTSILRLIWDQTAPLFMGQHIRKTCLAALIQFITFFTAHGLYMWFPYILNTTMLYTQQYEEPMCLCDILKFTQSSNFSNSNSLEDEQMENTCTTKLEISTYKHTITLEVIKKYSFTFVWLWIKEIIVVNQHCRGFLNGWITLIFFGKIIYK